MLQHVLLTVMPVESQLVLLPSRRCAGLPVCRQGGDQRPSTSDEITRIASVVEGLGENRIGSDAPPAETKQIAAVQETHG